MTGSRSSKKKVADSADAWRPVLSFVGEIDTSEWDVVPLEIIHSVIRIFHRAGVRLVLGDVLRTATINAAAALGLENEIGSLKVGKRADLLLTAGDPTKNLAELRSPRGVMHGGRWLDQAALMALFESAVFEGAWP